MRRLRAAKDWLLDGGVVVWYGGPWSGDPWDWTETKHCSYWLWRQRLSGWFACPLKGHTFYADHCGRREHDICSRCNNRRDRIDGRPVRCR